MSKPSIVLYDCLRPHTALKERLRTVRTHKKYRDTLLFSIVVFLCGLVVQWDSENNVQRIQGS